MILWRLSSLSTIYNRVCKCSIHPSTNHYHMIVTSKTPSTLAVRQFLSNTKIGWMYQIVHCPLRHHSLLPSSLYEQRAFHARSFTTKQIMRPLEGESATAPNNAQIYSVIQCPNMCPELDPYTCTSGRWLRHNKLEIDARYIAFYFDALCKRVIELCPGATSIAKCDKKEGGFNRVFIFTTDNAETVVAKLPFTFAGPPSLVNTYNRSAMLTIMLVQTNTSVPIPIILDWSDDPSNAISSEYIIMEHAAGTQLHQKWPTMTIGQQIRYIDAIYRKLKEVVDIKFTAYGSLYFADSSLDSKYRRPLNQSFSVGPHCGARYWDCNVGESRYYHNAKPMLHSTGHLISLYYFSMVEYS